MACHVGTLSIPLVKRILLHLAAHGIALYCNFSFLKCKNNSFSCSAEVKYFGFYNPGSLTVKNIQYAVCMQFTNTIVLMTISILYVMYFELWAKYVISIMSFFFILNFFFSFKCIPNPFKAFKSQTFELSTPPALPTQYRVCVRALYICPLMYDSAVYCSHSVGFKWVPKGAAGSCVGQKINSGSGHLHYNALPATSRIQSAHVRVFNDMNRYGK